MKKIILKNRLFIGMIGMILSVFTINTSTAQSSTKIFAVINEAKWCPVCKANGQRIKTEVIPAFTDGRVQFIQNNLTNKKTTAQSAIALNKDDIREAVVGYNSTGIIILVDASAKKAIGTVSIAWPTDKIISAIKQKIQQ